MISPILLGLLVSLAVLVWPARAPVFSWRPDRPGDNSRWRRLLARVAGTVPEEPDHRHLVPEALELLSLCLLAGGAPAAAARSVGQSLPPALGGPLIAVGEALATTADARPAWEAAGALWAPARHSLELAESAGVPPGVALRQVAQDIRRDAVSGVEVAAARLGVRLVIPLGLAFLPAFVLTTIVPVVLALMQGITW